MEQYASTDTQKKRGDSGAQCRCYRGILIGLTKSTEHPSMSAALASDTSPRISAAHGPGFEAPVSADGSSWLVVEICWACSCWGLFPVSILTGARRILFSNLSKPGPGHIARDVRADRSVGIVLKVLYPGILQE